MLRVPHLNAAERVIEQQVVVKLCSTGPIVRLQSQPLDFVEPGVEFLAEMLTQFGRKLEGNQLDKVLVDRVCQTGNDLLDVPFWV